MQLGVNSGKLDKFEGVFLALKANFEESGTNNDQKDRVKDGT